MKYLLLLLMVGCEGHVQFNGDKTTSVRIRTECYDVADEASAAFNKEAQLDCRTQGFRVAVIDSKDKQYCITESINGTGVMFVGYVVCYGE